MFKLSGFPLEETFLQETLELKTEIVNTNNNINVIKQIQNENILKNFYHKLNFLLTHSRFGNQLSKDREEWVLNYLESHRRPAFFS